jgi:uncharacterized membrane protein YdcZ (DUF606 family)
MLPLASELPSAMYTPLVLLLAGYVVFSLIAGRARANDDSEQADRYETLAFALVLVGGLYAVVLLVSAVVSYPNRVYDMVIILIVIGLFFALLLFIFFVIAEIIPGALRRGRDR